MRRQRTDVQKRFPDGVVPQQEQVELTKSTLDVTTTTQNYIEAAAQVTVTETRGEAAHEGGKSDGKSPA